MAATPAAQQEVAQAQASATLPAITNPLMGLRFKQSEHRARPKTGTASCSNTCKLADAFPQRMCGLDGSIVAAGVYIAAPEASPLWSILSSGIWTAVCSVIDSSYLSSGQFQALLNEGQGCYIEWTRLHKYSNTRCVTYYATKT
jgi:hypothetical protein